MPASPKSKGVVIITGANRGVGFQIAHRFASNNYKGTIIVCSRFADRGVQAINRLEFEFPEANFVSLRLDVTNQKNRQQFIEEIEKDYGKGNVDVLINNAGVHQLRIDEVLETNYFAVRDLTNEMLPIMNPEGRVVVLSSMDSDEAFAGCSEKVRFFLQSNTMKQFELDDMVDDFKNSYFKGPQEVTKKGFSSYNGGYGMSKVFCRALCSVLMRRNDHEDFYPNVKFLACCPGWCRTEMGGEFAPMTEESGADLPYWLATSEEDEVVCNNGEYWRDDKRMVKFGEYC